MRNEKLPTVLQPSKLMKILKHAGQFLYGFLFGSLLFVGLLVVVSGLNIPGGYKLYTVQSGSMEPTIHTGSIVTVQPQAEYQKGDIVTIRESAYSNVTLTHRIVDVKTKEGSIFYVTRGDANKTNDGEERPKANVIGKEIATVPYIGYILAYAKTKNGLLFLIIIPCLMLLVNELFTIKNEIISLLQSGKKKKAVFHRIRV